MPDAPTRASTRAGQVAGVRVETRLAPCELRRALNAVLPEDLAVLAVEGAPEGWHPRRSARRKLYRYAIWNGARALAAPRAFLPSGAPAPRRRGDGAGPRPPSSAPGTSAPSRPPAPGWSGTVRTLFRAELLGEAGGELALELEGDGFLRHMVRNVAGTLIEVGLGRRAPESLAGAPRGAGPEPRGPHGARPGPHAGSRRVLIPAQTRRVGAGDPLDGPGGLG